MNASAGTGNIAKRPKHGWSPIPSWSERFPNTFCRCFRTAEARSTSREEPDATPSGWRNRVGKSRSSISPRPESNRRRQNAGPLAPHIHFVVDDLTRFQASQTATFEVVMAFFYLERKSFSGDSAGGATRRPRSSTRRTPWRRRNWRAARRTRRTCSSRANSYNWQVGCTYCITGKGWRKKRQRSWSREEKRQRKSERPTAVPKIARKIEEGLVRGTGLEPARPCGHWLLRPARLPVPPAPLRFPSYHWPRNSLEADSARQAARPREMVRPPRAKSRSLWSTKSPDQNPLRNRDGDGVVFSSPIV